MNIKELKKLKDKNDKKLLEIENTFWKEALEFQKKLKIAKKKIEEDKEQDK